MSLAQSHHFLVEELFLMKLCSRSVRVWEVSCRSLTPISCRYRSCYSSGGERRRSCGGLQQHCYRGLQRDQGTVVTSSVSVLTLASSQALQYFVVFFFFFSSGFCVCQQKYVCQGRGQFLQLCWHADGLVKPVPGNKQVEKDLFFRILHRPERCWIR